MALASELWAALHAGVAPWLFGLAATLVTLNSAAWRQSGPPRRLPAARRLQRLSLGVTAAVYLLIVLGVLLRHLPYDGAIEWFEVWVWLKLFWAGLTACGLGWLLVDLWRRARDRRKLVRRAQLLAALFFVQSILGAATWVTHYEWPVWFTDYVWAISYTVVAEGRLQVLVATAHVTVGSLILGTSLVLTLWSFREVAANER